MRKTAVLAIAMLTALAVNSFAVDALSTPEDMIDGIEITGNSSVSSKEVIDQISYGIGMTYSTYKTREDIKNLYKTGKFDDIKMSLETRDGKNILVVDVREKLQINKVIIKGAKEVGEGDIKSKLEDAEKLGTAIKEGEYLDEYKLKKAIINIEQLYRERNYYYANAAYAIDEVEVEKDGKKIKKANIEVNIDEGEKLKVTSITASGNKVFSNDKIKGAMKTKEEGWFVSGTYNDDTFMDDLKAILNSYYQEGYVKARVNGLTQGELEVNRRDVIAKDVKIDREKKIITLEIPVDEGIKYTVKSLAIEGTKIFTPEEITGRLTLAPGKVFDRLQFDRDLSIIRQMYAEKGHIFAQIKDTYVFDDDTGDVTIKVAVDEADVAYVAGIKVRGNYVTKDKVILRELLIKEGEPFDSTKIRKSQEAVYNLGFFDNVLIDTEQVAMDKLNIVFEVEERKTGNVGLGAGYSTVEGLVGYVQLSQSNLFGEGKMFSADVQYGNQKKSWQLSYKDPWLFDTQTSFGVDLWNIYRNTDYNNQGYDLDTYGFNVSFGRKINEENKAYFTYRYQEDKYSNIQDEYKDVVKEGKSQISSISPMWVYDTRDDIFDTSKGAYASGVMQLGGGWLGGDYNYIKAVADLRYYVPSFWKFVAAARLKVGNAVPYGYSYGNASVPITEKFYCGGTDTVRGYEERGLGPIGGGNFTIVANLEYKLKLVERVLTAAVFFDAGNSWNNFNEVNWTDPYLYTAVGAGIRLTIPGTVMVLRLDYGYGLNPDKRVDGGKIHFNIGNLF